MAGKGVPSTVFGVCVCLHHVFAGLYRQGNFGDKVMAIEYKPVRTTREHLRIIIAFLTTSVQPRDQVGTQIIGKKICS